MKWTYYLTVNHPACPLSACGDPNWRASMDEFWTNEAGFPFIICEDPINLGGL